MSAWQHAAKRTLDLVLAVTLLIGLSWLMVITWVIATIDTRRNGFFLQVRIGRHGKPFRVMKVRTMRHDPDITTTVTTEKDPRITSVGRVLRRLKLDELPQLFNVLVGQMSFVGPRPDLPGWADLLEGDDRIILSVRPGITGPATLRFRNEEALLAAEADPEAYNREVIFPEKVRLNREYVSTYSLLKDLRYLWLTAIGRSLPPDAT